MRNGDSSGPAAPAQALLGTLTDAVNSTNLGAGPGVEPIHHIGKGTAITIAILAAIPAIVIPVVATRGSSGTTPVRNPNCDPATQKCP